MSALDIVSAMQGGLLQQDRLLRLDTPLGDDVLLPQRAAGCSRIGRHFDFALDVLTTRGDLKLKKLIGQSVTLWIQQADRSYLPRNGYVYTVRRLGAEGGLSSYQIQFASWMHFLKFRRDQRVWQDKAVDQILADVFSAHPQAQARFSFSLSKPLPPRSYCVQYEDDWNFVHRLMEEEGLFGIWKQADDGKSHSLMIVDRLAACEPLDTRTVQFSRNSTNSEVDGLVHWSGLRSLHSATLTTRTFDYKNPSPLANPKATSIPTLSHELPDELEIYEYTGPYTYLEQDRGDHLNKLRMEEWESRAKRFYETGGLRDVDAGRWFQLVGHPEHDRESDERNEFAVIETVWLIENNLPGSEHHGDLPHSLKARLAEAKVALSGQSVAGTTHFDGSQGLFLIEIEAQRKSVPFHSPFEHQKPVMQMQTATVVGPQGQPVYTDELGRVKVQFHWDRIGQRTESSSCWVRVSHPWAGQGFGMIHVPRIGDEVVVSFLNGSADRPLITGRVANGTNFVQWKLPDNQALSGMRSRDLAGAQANHFVPDDTPGKLQAQVSSDHEESRLVVGYDTRIDGNAGRAEARGTGWELATNSRGVLRANSGMLVTTKGRSGAAAAAKDMSETVDRLAKAQQLHDALTKVAQQSEAQDADGHQADIVSTIAAQNEQIKGSGASSSDAFPELSQPHLVIDGKSGVEITTPATVHVASQQAAITTEGHIGIASGRGFFATVRDTLRLFAQTGPMHLVSAAGDIVMNAMTKSIVPRAQKQILLESEEILLRAHKFRVEVNGSFFNLDASGVMSGTTGKFTAYAAAHELPGPKDQMVDLSPKKVCIECILKAARSGSALVLR
ncbi:MULTISPECIES: type VI secretion system Vgr family protein [unclassified Paraburkholderia]|uniref:type VI secretion system Vgr family protein n=1 Tax=unclassified Paraburkholderia TaxID=2615204 RepID=UPI002AB0DE14|nr:MULTISPECIES: type VI secretion system tip protein TssI/VgrG [unclassified Paraburkholderia]